jgi:hypothetical protein
MTHVCIYSIVSFKKGFKNFNFKTFLLVYRLVVKPFVEGEEKDDNVIRVHLGSEGHTGFRLSDPKERVEAKVAAGYRVGSRTYISKRG